MRLEPVWVEVILGGVGPVAVHGDSGDVGLRAPLTGAQTRAGLGPLVAEVEGAVDGTGWRLTWSIANSSDHPEAVRAVRVGCAVIDPDGPLGFWSHGYQSWSPSGIRRYGVDIDPSHLGHAPRLLRSMHHADEDRAEPGELRSELVCALTDDGGPVTVVGFLGGSRHDGTFRLGPSKDVDRPVDPRRPAPADRPATLVAEAFLGGALLGPGEDRDLHTVVATVGDDVHDLLVGWARSMGAASGARTSAPFQVGWCPPRRGPATTSEAALRTLVSAAASQSWPFSSVRLGDGYQAAVGDWLKTSDEFPSTVDVLAGDVRAAGFEPGVSISPFLLARSSDVAQANPDWIARWFTGSAPLVGMFDQRWGGTVYTLDTSNPEVLAHLEGLGRDLAQAGFRHLRVDFASAPSSGGRFHDPSLTPAQRVRAGLDALRRGIGDDVLLVGSGVPFGAVVGVVDATQTGPNAFPSWEHDAVAFPSYEGYTQAKPAIRHAVEAAVTRSFQHRTLWSNDPDCFLLEASTGHLSPAVVRAWGDVVAGTGASAIASGDLLHTTPSDRRRFDEVVAVGRETDAAARAGQPARAPALLEPQGPARLGVPDGELVIDLSAGSAEVVPVS
jgi:alpha-galactosidase